MSGNTEKKAVPILIDSKQQAPEQSLTKSNAAIASPAKATLDLKKLPCFPPAPYPLTKAEHETFERLIAQAVEKKLPVDENGHLNRRLGIKLLRAAFAPPGDPHESYLIKGDQPEKIGRTKEFGYLCTCWRGKGESCEGCAKNKLDALVRLDTPW